MSNQDTGNGPMQLDRDVLHTVHELLKWGQPFNQDTFSYPKGFRNRGALLQQCILYMYTYHQNTLPLAVIAVVMKLETDRFTIESPSNSGKY